MGSPDDQTPARRFGTVQARLSVAALQILVPIFALAIVGFVQLDAQSERFRAVASEAAKEMGLVEGLLTDLESAHIAAGEYVVSGDQGRLSTFRRVRPRVDAALAAAVRLDEPEERTLAVEAGRRWASLTRRVTRVQALRRDGRRVPARLSASHDVDVNATEGSVIGLLDSSRREIDAEVAAARRRRTRDLWLLALQIGLGGLLAVWVVRRHTRETVGPLARLGAAADRLRAGHHSERVEIDGPVELVRMGATFNIMAETLEAQQNDLRRQAYADGLTGLPNRLAFRERVETATAEARSATVLFLDLDDFKSVNDALGHSAGDALLVELSRRLQETVAAAGTVARLGGDEFAVLLVEGVEPDHPAAVQLAERVLAAISVPTTLSGVEVVPSASLGIASGSQSAAALLRDADVAMYEAKRAGRHGYAAFRPGMQTEAAQRLAQIADLRQALPAGQFRLVYQPIVELGSRNLRATEALLRWEHPERGMVSPADFIPLAEQTGLIVGIGGWVLRQACLQAAAWEARTPDPRRTMSVNLSPRQLLEPELVGQVASALQDAGLRPGQLMLEITESAVMADPRTAIARLEELHALGVLIALDDFGTGHSSLAYLRELPVDILKIAREFIAGVVDSPDDLALARGILGLGHGLGLQVIAEGIETEAQDARLREMGCDLSQGFLYARPLDAEAIPPLLRSSTSRSHAPAFVATAHPAYGAAAPARLLPTRR